MFVEDIRTSIEERLFNNKKKIFQIIESTAIDNPIEKSRTFMFGEADKPYRKYICENLTEKDKNNLLAILNNILYDAELEKATVTLHEISLQLGDKQRLFIKKMNEIMDNIEHVTNDERKILLGKCNYCEVSTKNIK